MGSWLSIEAIGLFIAIAAAISSLASYIINRIELDVTRKTKDIYFKLAQEIDELHDNHLAMIQENKNNISKLENNFETNKELFNLTLNNMRTSCALYRGLSSRDSDSCKECFTEISDEQT